MLRGEEFELVSHPLAPRAPCTLRHPRVVAPLVVQERGHRGGSPAGAAELRPRVPFSPTCDAKASNNRPAGLQKATRELLRFLSGPHLAPSRFFSGCGRRELCSREAFPALYFLFCRHYQPQVR